MKFKHPHIPLEYDVSIKFNSMLSIGFQFKCRSMHLQNFSDHNLMKLRSEQLQRSRVIKKIWVDMSGAAEFAVPPAK